MRIVAVLSLLYATEAFTLCLAASKESKENLAANRYDYYEVEDTEIQRKRVACGPNSLYMFVKAHGAKPLYDEVQLRLPMQTEGSTLLALKETAQHFGIRARALKCSPSDLVRLHLPAVVHFHRSVYFGDNANHYVLLTQVSADRIEFIDGTSGWVESISMGKFSTVSDGYVLEATGNQKTLWISLLPPVTALTAGAALLRRCAQWNPQSALKIACATVAFGFGLCETIADELPMRGDSPLPAAKSWRSPSHDAINALDLYLRTIGRPVSRERIDGLLPNEKASLLELTAASLSLGVPMQVVRPGVLDLESLPLPMILHMFDDKEQNGGYYLLLSCDSDGVQVINAAIATIETFSADDFRRRWSGYAITPKHSKEPHLRSAFIPLLGVAGYFMLRSRLLSRFRAINQVV